MIEAKPETALQLSVRDDFNRLINVVRNLPECHEKSESLRGLVRDRENAVVAAGRTQ